MHTLSSAVDTLSAILTQRIVVKWQPTEDRVAKIKGDSSSNPPAMASRMESLTRQLSRFEIQRVQGVADGEAKGSGSFGNKRLNAGELPLTLEKESAF